MQQPGGLYILNKYYLNISQSLALANTNFAVISSKAPSNYIEFEDPTSFHILEKLTENLNFDKPFCVEQKHCPEWPSNGAMSMTNGFSFLFL